MVRAAEVRDEVQLLTALAVEQATWLARIAAAVGANPDDDDELLPEMVEHAVRERDRLARELDSVRGSLAAPCRNKKY
ncbi:Uncharacterised protein [Mycobacteroides abscessus subsp. bolletii]|uniref:hypothetical protein n=1 Tax=Mycobacteroides abscessus TaxID=36809 RepID=UPI0009D4092E|nr:hypothetical protein [Mycobacteroides abscessus]SKY98179.1 Uncharacterised protein [Mycobacteroides abscessus subsp. bolletii]